MERHGLNNEQFKNVQETFDWFDRNKDGKINNNELACTLRLVGFNPTQAEVQEIIKSVDLTGDGTIHFNEFLKLMAEKFLNTDERKQLTEAFDKFDRNKDGKICAKELRIALTSIGETLSMDEVEDLISKADIDKDGNLCYGEFVLLMTEPHPSR